MFQAFAKWDLKYLQDPKGDMGKSETISGEANKAWASNNPQVVQWFKNFKLNPTQLGQLEMDINAASTPNAGADKWISDNQSVVNAWFAK